MKYLYMIGGALLAIVTALFSGTLIGKSKEREKQANKAADQAKRSNEIDDEVRHSGASSVRKRLRDYSRK